MLVNLSGNIIVTGATGSGKTAFLKEKIQECKSINIKYHNLTNVSIKHDLIPSLQRIAESVAKEEKTVILIDTNSHEYHLIENDYKILKGFYALLRTLSKFKVNVFMAIKLAALSYLPNIFKHFHHVHEAKSRDYAIKNNKRNPAIRPTKSLSKEAKKELNDWIVEFHFKNGNFSGSRAISYNDAIERIKKTTDLDINYIKLKLSNSNFQCWRRSPEKGAWEECRGNE